MNWLRESLPKRRFGFMSCLENYAIIAKKAPKVKKCGGLVAEQLIDAPLLQLAGTQLGSGEEAVPDDFRGNPDTASH